MIGLRFLETVVEARPVEAAHRRRNAAHDRTQGVIGGQRSQQVRQRDGTASELKRGDKPCFASQRKQVLGEYQRRDVFPAYIGNRRIESRCGAFPKEL
ncbi:hypothetical protein LZK73_29420 (plasmid) [Neorhizobium galegae]|nr:hypothetical protein LZK73_29420 [Neorhizobium galegae]